jgi:hypothetical protein
MEDLKYSAPEEGGEGDEIAMTQAEQDASWDRMMAEQRSAQYEGIENEVPAMLARPELEVPPMLDREALPYVSEPVEGPTEVVKDGFIPRLQERVGATPDGIWGNESSKALLSTMQSTEWNAEPVTAESVIDNLVDATVPSKVPELLLRPDMTQAGGAEPTEGSSSKEQNTLIESVFRHEGGYSNDKEDTGNYHNDKFVGTNHGISAPVLAEHLGRQPTVQDMKDLTKVEANAIYKKDYYDKYGIDSLPKDLQEIVLHSVVNSGSHGIKVVQEMLGIDVDGVAGPNTKAAMNKATFTKQEFKDKLMEKYKSFKTWETHGKGWDSRFQELAEI